MASYFARERRLAIIGAMLVALVALFVLAGIFLFSVGIIWLSLHLLIPLNGWICFLCAGSFVVLLFVGHGRLAPDYLKDLPFSTRPYSYGWLLKGGGRFNPLEPRYAHGVVKIIVSLLYIGPRLSKDALRLLLRYRLIGSVDLESCGAVLEYLAVQPGCVTMAALRQKFAGLNMDAVLCDLKLVDGILVLTVPEPGLALSDRLRAELSGF